MFRKTIPVSDRAVGICPDDAEVYCFQKSSFDRHFLVLRIHAFYCIATFFRPTGSAVVDCSVLLNPISAALAIINPRHVSEHRATDRFDHCLQLASYSNVCKCLISPIRFPVLNWLLPLHPKSDPSKARMNCEQ